MPADRKYLHEMAGEFCREACVLIFVFGNLDIWLKGFTGELDRLSIRSNAVIEHFLAVLFTSGAFGLVGVLLESWRRK